MVKIFQFIKIITNKFTSLILPYRCLCCDEIVQNYGICIECWSQISFINHPMCYIMGKPMDAFDTIYSKNKKDILCQDSINNPPTYKKLRSVAVYDKVVKKIIHRLKYNDSLNHSQWIAQMMCFHAKEIINECNIIIPVPLHRLRLFSRKFNQSSLISQHMIENINHPMKIHDNILIRSKHTKPQVGLDFQNRKQNVENAFSITNKGKNIIQGKNILLVDDVITTGSTINNCSKILLQNGAKNVYVCTFAMATYDS